MDSPGVLLTRAHFTPIIGRVFGAGDAPDQPSYALIAAKPLPANDYPGRQRDPFVLIFRANTPEPVQGIRVFDVPEVGPTEIFLVPVERTEGLVTYEAVFN